MQQELIKSFNELFSSFEIFKINLRKAKENHEKELAAQRFEFILESYLKNIKLYLTEKSYDCIYPTDCVKAAAKFGLVMNESSILEMLDDKYRLSHLKNQKIPDEIFERIKFRYLIILGKSFEKIKKQFISPDPVSNADQ